MIEEGKLLMELPPQLETFDPSSQQAKDILDEVTSQSIAALRTYQDEVQRLATQLQSLMATPPDSVQSGQ